MNQYPHKYYIFIPANKCSGGPEALHQLVYYMRKIGLDAYAVYYEYSGFVCAKPITRYEQYGVTAVVYSDIEDKIENYIIAPENAPWCLNGFKKAKKCIWWLGVKASQLHEAGLFYRMIYWKRRLLGQSILEARNMLFNPEKCLHLCGSKFAFEYVKQKFPKSVVEYLVEPISLDFLMINNIFMYGEKEDIVLYNPSKPSKIMEALLERKRFNYIPLKGFLPEKLAEYYKKAKLYVDFGEFGGPERMPKEAVYFGCNILVANHNAANNDFDVAIPNKYKVDDCETVEQVEIRIEEMLLHYKDQTNDFLLFKAKVDGLEENFIKQLKKIFYLDE